MTKYRQVGGRLGAYIRANHPSTQQIQGLLADLLAGDPLLPTMREVVAMPAFAALQGLAGSGGGVVQRDALLQELAKRYLPAVVDEAGQLVNGMLDQPAGATTYGSDSTVNPERSPSTTHEQESQAKALKDLQEKYDQVITELSKLKSMQPQGGQSTTPNNKRSSSHQRKASERTSAESRQISDNRSEDAAYRYIKPDTNIDPRCQTDPAYRYIQKKKEGASGKAQKPSLLAVLFIPIALTIVAAAIGVSNGIRDRESGLNASTEKATWHPSWEACRSAQDIRQPDYQTPGESTKPLNSDGLGRFPPDQWVDTQARRTWWGLNCSTIPGMYDW